MNRRLIAAALLGSALLGGCATSSPENLGRGRDMVQANRHAAQVLARDIVARHAPGAPVIVATVANLDKLDQSSSVGRMVSEQVAAGLVSAGVPVVELKLRNHLFMRSAEGELMLSREVKDLSMSHRAGLVVVGTYTVAGGTIFVTLKAVDPNNNVAVAAHSYSMPLGAFSPRSW